MNDSADMNDGPEKTADLATAARALGDALGALETALDPVIGRLGGLERQAREAEALQEDRTKLAARLDDALEARRKREEEFSELSRQTREELDRTIETLRDALAGPAGGEA